MSKKRSSTVSNPKTDWEQVDAATDAQVREAIEADPDAQPTNEEFWKTARIVLPRPKETITIRLDADVLEWFRKRGKGYQTRINAILRSYMHAREDGNVPNT